MLSTFLLLLTLSTEAPMLLRDAHSVQLMETGRSQVLNLRLADAETTLYRLARRPDGSAAAYYHLATASLLKLILADRPESYDEFFVRSDSLRDVLGSHRGSVWRDHLLAENDLQRALAWSKKGSYVKAAMAAVGAYRRFRKLIEEHPDFSEPYKGLGTMHAVIGALPSNYRRFLRVFGFDGTLQQGIDELERAAVQSRFHREEAIVLLGALDGFGFQTPRKAIDAFEGLHRTYPDSPLFALLYGDALLKSRRVEEAAIILEGANRHAKDGIDLLSDRGMGLRADRPGQSFRVHYADFFLAEARFRQDDFDAAILVFRQYLREHQGQALKAIGWLHLGEALEMSDDRVRAEEAYRTAVAAREFESDAAAARAARNLLAVPMDRRARTLILARNAFDRDDSERAIGLLQEILSDPDAAAAERGEAWYRMGRVLDESGDATGAVPFYRRAAEAPGDPEAKWGPFSWYYLGRLHEAAGRTDSARNAYSRVIDYEGDYDFRGALEKLAQTALTRL